VIIIQTVPVHVDVRNTKRPKTAPCLQICM